MKTYVVGGAVRDELLGLAVQDRDHVVVGATPEQMAKAGFRPVGADFPVFLHPETHEEYALARTERKTAPGYRGFVFHADPAVTLEEDLRRRDLTINAMARGEDGALVDPYGGERDLRAGVLRHVSAAFAEDPVRILRVARFAARFGFAVAPETMALMRQMVDQGEADALVPERVWQELSRGLMEPLPSRMLAVLDESGALRRVLCEVADPATARHRSARLDFAAGRASPLPVRFALLCLDATPDDLTALALRINAPGDCREIALLAARERALVSRGKDLGAADMLGLLERCDTFRRPERLEQLLEVAQCDALVDDPQAFPPRGPIERARLAARDIDAASIAAAHPGGVAEAIHAARLAAIARIT